MPTLDTPGQCGPATLTRIVTVVVVVIIALLRVIQLLCLFTQRIIKNQTFLMFVDASMGIQSCYLNLVELTWYFLNS